MKLYEALTYYRKLRKITFDELVDKTHLSKSTLQKIFTGVTANPAFETVQTIAEAMGTSVNDISAATKEASPEMLISPAARNLAREYDRLSETSQKLISAIILFESADIEMKNKVIAMLVDHANDKLSESTSFEGAFAEPFAAMPKIIEALEESATDEAEAK